MKYRYTVFILAIILAIFALAINGAAGALNCQDCHTNNVGKVSANETIVIDEKTCFKCHSSEYVPGYEELKGKIHSIHTGGIKGLNVDYITRHPKTGLACETCHQKEIKCQSCHVRNIPHVKDGDSCSGCHGPMEKVFGHKKIELKIHDIFGGSSCSMCHDMAKKSLRLANGDIVRREDSYSLCNQCHSNVYKLWISGNHWSNESGAFINSTREELINPEDPDSAIRQDVVQSFNTNWARENRCVNCHNVHDPTQLYWKLESGGYNKKSDSIYLIAFLGSTIPIIYYINKRRRNKYAQK